MWCRIDVDFSFILTSNLFCGFRFFVKLVESDSFWVLLNSDISFVIWLYSISLLFYKSASETCVYALWVFLYVTLERFMTS